MSFAVIFSGQGSQSLGMLAPFGDEPLVRQTFAEASELISFDLWHLCQEGPAKELNRTINAQPAVLTAGVALWRLWRQRTDSLPRFMAGHSLGEYTALVCANSLQFDDAVTLVRNRGKYMQMAVADDEGAMAAILGLTTEQVSDLCHKENSYVQPANMNSPQQTVIAGYKQAVEKVANEAKELGAKRVVFLPVSVPSHCALMQSATDLLAADFGAISLKAPQIDVLHNLDARTAEDIEALKTKLIQQLIRPVQWVDTIEEMRDQGMTRIVECGPGRVLSGLNRAIDKDLISLSLGKDLGGFEDAVKEVSQ